MDLVTARITMTDPGAVTDSGVIEDWKDGMIGIIKILVLGSYDWV